MIIPIELITKENIKYNIEIDLMPNLSFDTKVAIITNPTISNLHLNYLLSKIDAKDIYTITIPDGEEYKTIDTVLEILDECFKSRLDRKSILIAFGGGVIGDITGFSASLYQRGIDFIQIPTTLLSQVDASVGGKTGVNNSYGKNLIGAFYQPKAVYIDTHFLNTLPQREFSSGVAEIVKMGVMFDKEFFNFLKEADLRNETDLKEAIKKSVELKAWVVNQDEKEAGIRAVLNYGHTFAHVIENETNYKTFLHGEAVSIGIVMANELAIKLNLFTQEEAKEVKKLLEKYALPIDYKIKDIDSFYQQFFLDKKSSKGNIKFILPNSIGNYKIENNIEEELVKSVLSLFKEK